MPRYLGQHFLKNSAVLKKIAEALELSSGDTVIEIGAGHGELTGVLAEIAFRQEPQMANSKAQGSTSEKDGFTLLGDIVSGVSRRSTGSRASAPVATGDSVHGNNISEGYFRIIAIEKDARLALGLKKKFADDPHVIVVEGDVRELLRPLVQNLKPTCPEQRRRDTYKLVGNIPYYLTNFLFRIISELPHKPLRAILMIQKEVAERLTATPPRMNKLAASVQFWAQPTIIARVLRSDFDPPPRVDSSIIVLEPKDAGYNEEQITDYYKAVRALFAQPRKTVGNNLRQKSLVISHKSLVADRRIQTNKKEGIAERLERIGVYPSSRPQNLSIEDIKKISKEFFGDGG